MDPGKEKDMTTMNRFDYFNREHRLSAALYSQKEWGLCFMCSSKERQIRGNCVVGYGCS